MKDRNDSDYKREVGQRLRAAREALGLSQTEMCKEVDVATNRYNQWEMGRNFPDLSAIKRMKVRFGVTFEWIYDGDVSSLPHSIAAILMDRAS